jgi:hypothetical protein
MPRHTPRGTPTSKKLEGVIALGNNLKVFTKISPGKGFPAKVTEMVPNKRMVWSFSAPLGVFKGARVFTLEEKSGLVEFFTREEFSGWMSGLIKRKMPDLQPSFDAWAADLKRHAESLAAGA